MLVGWMLWQRPSLKALTCICIDILSVWFEVTFLKIGSCFD
jgi:hypothetical protein